MIQRAIHVKYLILLEKTALVEGDSSLEKKGRNPEEKLSFLWGWLKLKKRQTNF